MLGGYETVRLVHGIVAYMLLPYTIVHAILQWVFGRFWSIFKAQFYQPHLRAGLVSLAIVLPVIAGLYLWNEVPETMTVVHAKGDRVPVLDGDPSDAAWNLAKAVTIRTVKGVNNPRAHVDVTVKPATASRSASRPVGRSRRELQALPPEDRERLEGPPHVVRAPRTNTFYEDKLSMYITDDTQRGCADTCHVGTGPHAARDEKHGVHQTKGEVGDIWHWKSVRTDPMGADKNEPGFMDDQHFQGPDPLPLDRSTRFTGGYSYRPRPRVGIPVQLREDRPVPASGADLRPAALPARHQRARFQSRSEDLPSRGRRGGSSGPGRFRTARRPTPSRWAP